MICICSKFMPKTISTLKFYTQYLHHFPYTLQFTKYHIWWAFHPEMSQVGLSFYVCWRGKSIKLQLLKDWCGFWQLFLQVGQNTLFYTYSKVMIYELDLPFCCLGRMPGERRNPSNNIIIYLVIDLVINTGYYSVITEYKLTR